MLVVVFFFLLVVPTLSPPRESPPQQQQQQLSLARSPRESRSEQVRLGRVLVFLSLAKLAKLAKLVLLIASLLMRVLMMWRCEFVRGYIELRESREVERGTRRNFSSDDRIKINKRPYFSPPISFHFFFIRYRSSEIREG